MRIAGALYDFDRFHRFDAILDDKVPAAAVALLFAEPEGARSPWRL